MTVVPLDQAIRFQIRRQLETVRAKYGADHEGSWIDELVDDRKTLQHLRTLSRTGSLYVAVAWEV